MISWYLVCVVANINRSKGPVLIGLEKIVQRQVGGGVGR